MATGTKGPDSSFVWGFRGGFVTIIKNEFKNMPDGKHKGKYLENMSEFPPIKLLGTYLEA